MKSMTRLIPVFALVLFLIPACAQKQADDPIADNRIATNVRTKLSATTGVKTVPVIVEVRQGVVYLSGEAATSELSGQVEEAARGAEGVTRIVNKITVLDAETGGSGRGRGGGRR